MILITGAKGFIGSRLLTFLNEKGHEATGINEEITDIDKLRPYFKNAEFVVHLVAKVNDSKTERKSNDFIEINVGGTMNVVKLSIEYGCKLINTSSIDYQSKYGISKALAEGLVRSYARFHGLQAVSLRPCIIYEESSGERYSYISRYYPLGKLIKDIENIILHHNFKKYKVYKIGGIGQKLYWRKAVLLKRKIKHKLYLIKKKIAL